MSEKRCESKFEIEGLRDVSNDDAWMLTYIITYILKVPTAIRDIYQMLTGDDTNNATITDHAIDFILLDSLGNGYGYHASKILRHEDIKTERELVEFVYKRDYGRGVFRLGPSALADIATYMNIRNIIPKDSSMSDVISHFMNGAKAEEALDFANTKYRNYMEDHKNER